MHIGNTPFSFLETHIFIDIFYRCNLLLPNRYHSFDESVSFGESFSSCIDGIVSSKAFSHRWGPPLLSSILFVGEIITFGESFLEFTGTPFSSKSLLYQWDIARSHRYFLNFGYFDRMLLHLLWNIMISIKIMVFSRKWRALVIQSYESRYFT